MRPLLGGRYEYDEQTPLGRGGMAVIVAARDTDTSAEVAVKFLEVHLRGEEVYRKRLRREAKVLSRLTGHPYVVQLVPLADGQPFGEDENVGVFFVMARLEGKTLQERLRTEGPLSLAEAASRVDELCWAIQSGHELRIFHRDIKPGN